MNAAPTKPFGLWNSALSPKMLSTQLRLNDVMFAGDGQTIVWCERRSGQNVLVAKRPGEAFVDLTTSRKPQGGVGYGGGSFSVHDDSVFFADADGKLYRVDIDQGIPQPLTPSFGSIASPCISPRGDWVVYIHTYDGQDVIGAIDAKGCRWPIKLISGADFYMQPTWHPQSTRLAWISWDQPNMPWNGSRLETATVHFTPHGLTVGEVEVFAGGKDESVQQPIFSPDGTKLAYTSDASGFVHICVRDLMTGSIKTLSSGRSEHAPPAWIQGIRTIAWAPKGDAIMAIRNEDGILHLHQYNLDGTDTHIDGLQEYAFIAQLDVAHTGQMVWMGSSSTLPPRIAHRDSDGTVSTIRRATSERFPSDHYSAMRTVSWEAKDKTQVFGNYYPPHNPKHTAPSTPPPAIIMIHGGPTTQRTAAFDERNQFFATRGFAVLDVNYRGSTGYGREYMNALFGEWGILDVEDAVGGVEFLANSGLADRHKIAIMGGSAGGYTVLQALVDHPGVFAAGVCMYGISNLFTLAMGTHKFEASYNDSLVGVLPKDADTYKERSPMFKVDALKDPVAIFQGNDDKVVPRDQSDAIVASLRERGVDHVYHVYEGEGHGWRKPETIAHFYAHTLAFLKRTLIFS